MGFSVAIFEDNKPENVAKSRVFQHFTVEKTVSVQRAFWGDAPYKAIYRGKRVQNMRLEQNEIGQEEKYFWRVGEGDTLKLLRYRYR